MTCDEARAAFSDLYDGALSGEPLAALDRHLDGCAACREEWDIFLKTLQAVAELGGAEPSPGFASRVLGQVETPTRWQRVARALFFPVRVKVPIQALALALVALTAVMIFQRSPELRRGAELRAMREAQPPVSDNVEGEKRRSESFAREQRDGKARGDRPGATALPTPKEAKPEPAAPALTGRLEA